MVVIDLTRFKRMILRAASISITVIGLTHLQACATGQYPSSAESEVKFHFDLMDFTPDNQMLIFSYDLPNGLSKIGFYLLESKTKLPIALPVDHSWREPAVSPDGRFLALVSSCVSECAEDDKGSQIALIDLSRNEPNFQLLTKGPGYRSSPVFTNDSKYIVYAFGPDNGRSVRGLARVGFDQKEEILQKFDHWGIVLAVRHAFFDSIGNYYAAIFSADSEIRKPLKNYKRDSSFPILYKFEKETYNILGVVEFAKYNFVSSPSILNNDEIIYSGMNDVEYEFGGFKLYSGKDSSVSKLISSDLYDSYIKSSHDGSVIAIIASNDHYSQKDIYLYRPLVGFEKTGISDEIIADLQR
jgi:Tol biopolymer transport system component